MFERIRKCRCQKWESEKVRNLHIFCLFLLEVDSF